MSEVTLTTGQLAALIFVCCLTSNIVGGVLQHCFFRWWCNSVQVLDEVWVKPHD